jgi:hypothetical protein
LVQTVLVNSATASDGSTGAGDLWAAAAPLGSTCRANSNCVSRGTGREGPHASLAGVAVGGADGPMHSEADGLTVGSSAAMF